MDRTYDGPATLITDSAEHACEAALHIEVEPAREYYDEGGWLQSEGQLRSWLGTVTLPETTDITLGAGRLLLPDDRLGDVYVLGTTTGDGTTRVDVRGNGPAPLEDEHA